MVEDRFLDDFRVGEKSVSGGVTITESEIIHFALLFDPQSFHLVSQHGAAVISFAVNHLLHRRGQ
jgi:acyl dehydratase